MKKIIFCCMPMKDQSEVYAMHYKVAGNSTIEYEGAVRFPVNAVLARTLKEADEVKIVLLKKDDERGNGDKNIELFKAELNAINNKIGADSAYKVIETPFDETNGIQEKLYRAMVGELEDDAQIMGDITYGPKPLPMVMLSVFRFAEKFFGADIKNIIYGKVNFITGESMPRNPVIYDITALYYLNAVTEEIEADSSAEAVKLLDLLIEI